LMKWRFMVAVIKLKVGQNSSDEGIEETLKRIMSTQVTRYTKRIE